MSSFRAATYNVHSCIGTDRHFSPERIVDALNQINADVVALQELGWHHRGQPNFDQFAFIEAMTDYHVLAGPTKDHARAHYGNAILVREPTREHRLIDISTPLHIPRGCMVAKVKLAGEVRTVINVHLGLTPWERQNQLKHILTEIDTLRGDIILMGDFNIWRTGSSILRPLKKRLPHFTSPPSFHTRAPRAPLDRIYLSPDLTFDNVEVWRTPLTERASDHLPVVADISPAQVRI